MAIIIHVTKHTLVAPESEFRRKNDGSTIMDLVLPKPASKVLGIAQGITVRAMYHPRSETYAFSYRPDVRNPGTYRAIAPIPIAGLETSDHWQDCPPCRQGNWCKEGQRLIDGALESAVQA